MAYRDKPGTDCNSAKFLSSFQNQKATSSGSLKGCSVVGDRGRKVNHVSVSLPFLSYGQVLF